MSRPSAPVTLPRARFEVDQDGHLAITVDDQPWQPPTDSRAPARAGGVPLGRSDVPWAGEQIAEELDTPVLVRMIDDGQAYEPYFVVPDSYQRLAPNSPSSAALGEAGPVPVPGPESSPDGRRGFTPGEPVTVVVVVSHAVADKHGAVRFRLPPALGDRTHALLVQGQISGTSIPYDDLTQPSGHAAHAGTTQAPGSTGAPDLTRPAVRSRAYDLRRTPGRRPAPAPAARPAPAAPDVPDAGLGAL